MKYEITKLCPIIRFRTGETEKIGGEITSASDFAAFSDLPDGRVHRGFSVYTLVYTFRVIRLSQSWVNKLSELVDYLINIESDKLC